MYILHRHVNAMGSCMHEGYDILYKEPIENVLTPLTIRRSICYNLVKQYIRWNFIPSQHST